MMIFFCTTVSELHFYGCCYPCFINKEKEYIMTNFANSESDGGGRLTNSAWLSPHLEHLLDFSTQGIQRVW